MFDLPVGFFGQLGQGFAGTFELVVFVKMFLGVFLGGKLGIEGDPNLLIGVIIQAFQFLSPPDSS